MASDDVFARIKQLSKIHSSIGAASWRYVHEGVITINESAEIASFGHIVYANPNYELGQALKMGDWHFTIERKSAKGRLALPDRNDPIVYVLVAFHKNEHYNFGIVICDDQYTLPAFVNLTLSTMGPIISPDIAQPLLDESKKVRIDWKRDPPPCRPGKIYISIPLK